ncbi:hypothetical protein N7495_007645 [Penicillium taxi]|uniref:uncharacterized protein n=1 Tax=Penicillium taxi TaxID=168475 RepID=UPI0025457E49|nr:uncharacterized protein N7495_007645 [Penicillium taxi]KAJ5887604.1 hypothetical protein N7495_007645 [Penicillium taxi]
MGSISYSSFTLENVPGAAEDPLYRLMREYREDKDANKIDLGIGAYRDSSGKPWVLPIFAQAGFAVKEYPYYLATTRNIDIEGMLESLRDAPRGSTIVLQACAHNPTGIDPTQEDWKQIAQVIRERSHFPFIDCAYQGFASGDLLRDSWVCRYFIEQDFECCIAQSFAKNLGLYGERAGAFHFICAPGSSATELATRISSQLAIIQRAEISNPPSYGSKIASCVLNDEALFSQWQEELCLMSGRLAGVRKEIQSGLEERGTPGSWSHLSTQIGMFSYTGLSKGQIRTLKEKWHIYMVSLS